jgi:WhiB family redox-sensing transcriptional regulator
MSATTRLGTTPASNPMAWMEDGLCRQVDADLFFPEGVGNAITVQNEQAKQVCNLCTVKQLCLDWALETGQRTGVWGGTSPDERLDLREVPDGSQFLLCLDQQEFIEARVADGGTHREIAEELGVGHHAVGRAWRYFESERKAQDAAAAEEVAA